MSDAVIKDAELAEYLKDKITVKPSYGYDTTAIPEFLKQTYDGKAAAQADREHRNNRNLPRKR